jgi:hypothetical protein
VDRARQRSRTSRKYGIKDINIDRQILVLHQAMGNKLLANPELKAQMQCNLENRYSQGRIAYGTYLSWCTILELSTEPEQFMLALLEDSPKMRRLRRDTPFIGLLSEEERQAALNKGACGEVDITTLL